MRVGLPHLCAGEVKKYRPFDASIYSLPVPTPQVSTVEFDVGLVELSRGGASLGVQIGGILADRPHQAPVATTTPCSTHDTRGVVACR